MYIIITILCLQLYFKISFSNCRARSTTRHPQNDGFQMDERVMKTNCTDQRVRGMIFFSHLFHTEVRPFMTVTSPSDNLNALPKLKTSFPRCRPPRGASRMLCISARASSTTERDRKFSQQVCLFLLPDITYGLPVAYIASCYSNW